ncbi:MAG: bifunctional diaminohydroxyphosphoribosylaminopyrimidine deaminase/5-amino-6-(5-phosphoribosylamino)uracil reductase RibD [Halioglobus sp.]
MTVTSDSAKNPTSDLEFDTRMMARALQLARKAQYWAKPNPHVGCVLVKNGHVIGEGFTQPAGGNHAEVQALQAAQEDVNGATAYVTLEPCSHQGKTGPCADALIAAGVSRVVVAMQDPNPQVAGQGVARLEASGIDVVQDVLEAEASQVIPGFIARMTRGRGRVRAKLAMSLDGRTAMASGESQWITGAAARADVQRLRASSCAVVTGIGTVLADDCALTLRADQLGLSDEERDRAMARPPMRVVVDSKLRLHTGARVLSADAETLVVHGNATAPSKELLASGANFIGVSGDEFGLMLPEIIDELSKRQANEILVESGPRLAGALLRAGLLDELVIYAAPVFMGSSAQSLLDLPIDTMAGKINLELTDVRRVGQDWRFTVTPQ